MDKHRSTSTPWKIVTNLPRAAHLSLLRSLQGMWGRPTNLPRPQTPVTYLDQLATPDPPMTATGGPISAAEMPDDGTFASDLAWAEAVDAQQRVTHTSTLAERHVITLPAGATGDNVAVARLHAEAYARARGFDLPAGSIGVLSRRGKLGDEYIGVTFDVVVGKGDISPDQRSPGVLDRWTWSGGALQWWRKVLGNGDGRQGRVLARLDERDRGRRVVPGPWRGADALHGFDQANQPGGPTVADQMPPWMRRADGDDSEGE